MGTLRLAAVLILLHGPDGNEIHISPEQVTSLRAPIQGKHFDKALHCMVNLTDGKFVAVIETCETVQKMMENIR